MRSSAQNSIVKICATKCMMKNCASMCSKQNKLNVYKSVKSVLHKMVLPSARNNISMCAAKCLIEKLMKVQWPGTQNQIG